MESPQGSSKRRVPPQPEGSAKYIVQPKPLSVPEPRPRRVILPWIITAITSIGMILLLIPYLRGMPVTEQSPSPAPTQSSHIDAHFALSSVSSAPTGTPATLPSESAAPTPTITPTPSPTPTAKPTAVPTATPTLTPSPTPTAEPTAVPTATPTLTPAPAASDIRVTMIDGRLNVSWQGTVGATCVRATDTSDELPDDRVFEEVCTDGHSATLLAILPGHTYTISVYPESASSTSPEAVSTTYSAAPAVSLGKYNLQLMALDFFSHAPGKASAASSAEGRPAAQIAEQLRNGEKTFALRIMLSHQQLSDDRDVLYSLEIKAPNGASLALSMEGALLLGSGESTTCVFDCTDAFSTLLENGCLTSGWYTFSLNIDGRHAVKHSIELN